MSFSYYFYSRCPGKGCSNSTPGYWYHSSSVCDHGSGNKTKVDRDGDLWCEKCANYSPFIKWKFRCEDHRDFREPDPFYVLDVLSQYREFKEYNDDNEFLSKLSTKIMEQCIAKQNNK